MPTIPPSKFDSKSINLKTQSNANAPKSIHKSSSTRRNDLIPRHESSVPKIIQKNLKSITIPPKPVAIPPKPVAIPQPAKPTLGRQPGIAGKDSSSATAGPNSKTRWKNPSGSAKFSALLPSKALNKPKIESNAVTAKFPVPVPRLQSTLRKPGNYSVNITPKVSRRPPSAASKAKAKKSSKIVLIKKLVKIVPLGPFYITSSPASFSDLPFEIKLLLINKFEHEDLLNLRLVSKAYKAAVDPHLDFGLLYNNSKPIEINTELDDDYDYLYKHEWHWNIGIPYEEPRTHHEKFQMETQISSENWSANMGIYFHKLQINDIWKPKDSLPTTVNGLNVNEFIKNLSPNITSLTILTNEFPYLDLSMPKQLKTFSKFMKQFTNLKEVIFCWDGEDLEDYDKTSAKLDIMLRSVKSKVKIKMRILNDYEDSMKRFWKIPNIKFIMEIHCEHYDLEVLDDFYIVCKKYLKRILEVKIDLKLRGGYYMNPRFHEQLPRRLSRFSPFLTSLNLSQMLPLPPLNVGFLNPYSIWTKLCTLQIVKYQQPLEILKHCPKLKKLILKLGMYENYCIFHNAEKTDKESLNEYFGNLSGLKELKISSRKIESNDELKLYLKTLFSPDTKVSYE